MSRKDYQAIADAIKTATMAAERYGFNREETVQRVIVELANVFADDNPRFDYARFQDACE